jgi:hypothetical protein
MTDKKLIGIIGGKNTGKDTVGSYLIEKEGFTKYAFDNPVKQICQTLFSLSDEQLNNRILKDTKDSRWDISPRDMMQRIETDFGQFTLFKLFPELKNKIKYREMWITLFSEWLLKNQDKHVVTDVRFKHEAAFIKESGGINIRLNRLNRLNRLSDQHIELRNIPDDLVDYEVDNNYELVDLYSQIDTIIYVPF